MSVLEWVVAASLGLVFYSYALYPLILALVAMVVQLRRDARYVSSKQDRRVPAQARMLPAVAVIISAYNEQMHLRQRIDNLLTMNYPPELLRCYIGSDGSSDATASILAACTDRRIQACVYDVNRGKASVLNDLVAQASAPILVFSDANTFFHPDAITVLVKHFDQADVGGVSGELRLKGSGGDNQDSVYWRLEQFLKFFEGRINGLLGANGAIYAIRRNLWQPLPPDTICDDFCVAMNVSASGHRLVYEPAAWAEEDTPQAIAEEYNRRLRIGIGNFQALVRHPEYITRTSLGTSFAYLSHKVLRWTAPHLLLLGLVASAILATQSIGWLSLTLLQLAAYGAAMCLYQLTQRQVVLPSLLRMAAFLYALNWAFMVASWRFARGNYRGSWRRTER
ncbi:glycosyltransferase family 2 protein [Aquabacterium sp.]|uniref:glycosyltransferase family 2 protein n=1 Tax=Aquabacterium sp. TaxID=1872578 RepID=UPI00248A4701|nr:glycosyltransferase family 2 protein [Aquabacterium sp.]MDI1261171.1 glycosyltransferase family 2 protein [Aquabacterium sp.]